MKSIVSERPAGNGPSGICLSYLLAGNWPHYTGEAHPGDEMLTARLRYSVATQTASKPSDEEDVDDGATESSPLDSSNAKSGQSACRACQRQKRLEDETDACHCFARFSGREELECLSAGLEGRNSGKPLSLLMDQLQHPHLDAGLDVPSLLDWKSPEQHAEHKVIDHVVLGKGPPGGTWHVSYILIILLISNVYPALMNFSNFRM